MADVNEIELSGVVERARFYPAGPVLEVRLRVEEWIGGKSIVNCFPLVVWGKQSIELDASLGKHPHGTPLRVRGRLHDEGSKSRGQKETRVVVREYRLGTEVAEPLPFPQRESKPDTVIRIRELIGEQR